LVFSGEIHAKTKLLPSPRQGRHRLFTLFANDKAEIGPEVLISQGLGGKLSGKKAAHSLEKASFHRYILLQGLKTFMQNGNELLGFNLLIAELSTKKTSKRVPRNTGPHRFAFSGRLQEEKKLPTATSTCLWKWNRIALSLTTRGVSPYLAEKITQEAIPL
jgi:hypothetical protein